MRYSYRSTEVGARQRAPEPGAQPRTTRGPGMAGTAGRYRQVLANRDFRLLISAFIVDSVGGWAYNIVLVVYQFDRTGSTAWVAATTASAWLPRLFLSAPAGALADRYERTTVMVTSALASFLCMTALAVVVVRDGPVLLVLLLAALTAACTTFYSPAASAVLPDVVPEQDLVTANALFALLENLVVVVGPALGGLLLLADEPGAAVVLNALSFLLAALLLLRMRTRSRGGAAEEGTSLAAQLVDGARALRAEPVALALVLFCALDSAVFGASTVLYIPISEKLGTGPEGYSYLLAAQAIGGVLVATVVDRFTSARRLAPVIVGGMWVLALPTALTVFAGTPPVGFLLQLVAGGGMIVVDVLATTALQRDLPRAVLSRVFGILDAATLAGTVSASVLTSVLLHLLPLDTVLVVVGVGFAVLTVLGIGPLLRADRKAAAGLAALAPRIALLEVLDLFASAPRGTLELLARAVEEVRVPAGAHLVREGEPADALYVLVEGEVAVSARGEAERARRLRTLGPRSYFGEIGLLHAIPRTATVRALEPCVLWRIAAEDFRSAVETGSPSPSLMQLAGARLARSHPVLAQRAGQVPAQRGAADSVPAPRG